MSTERMTALTDGAMITLPSTGACIIYKGYAFAMRGLSVVRLANDDVAVSDKKAPAGKLSPRLAYKRRQLEKDLLFWLSFGPEKPHSRGQVFNDTLIEESGATDKAVDAAIARLLDAGLMVEVGSEPDTFNQCDWTLYRITGLGIATHRMYHLK